MNSLRSLPWLAAVAGIAGLALASACGGDDDEPVATVTPTVSPTSTPTVEITPTTIPTLTTTPIPTLAPTQIPPQVPDPDVVYRFDSLTTEEDKAIIERGIKMANRLFFLQLGRVVDRQIVVSTFGSLNNPCGTGALATAGEDSICIHVGNEYWFSANLGATEQNKLKTVAHEYYHTLQSWLGCSPRVDWSSPEKRPTWLFEGSAEFMGHAALDFAKVEKLDYQITLWRANDKRSSYLPALSTWETIEPGEKMPYVVPALAVSTLVSRAGLSSIVSFCELRGQQGVAWEYAFSQSFGLTISDFYAQFEMYRANGYR